MHREGGTLRGRHREKRHRKERHGGEGEDALRRRFAERRGNVILEVRLG